MSFPRPEGIFRSAGRGSCRSGARSERLHAPTHRLDEFPTGYSLAGLRSRRARLRFTGRGEVYNEGRSPGKPFSANGETLLSGLSHYRGPPQLVVARELLSETGSIFVQIGDENVHLVRCLMDEVFGSNNISAVIAFTKAAGGLQAARRTGTILDYILWYGKDVENSKYRPLFERRLAPIGSGFTQLELPDGTRRSMTSAERSREEQLDVNARCYMSVLMTKPGPGSKYTVEFRGRTYDSGKRWWGTTPDGMEKVIQSQRAIVAGNSLRFITFFDDFPLFVVKTSSLRRFNNLRRDDARQSTA